jgi:hypothetical protein
MRRLVGSTLGFAIILRAAAAGAAEPPGPFDDTATLSDIAPRPAAAPTPIQDLTAYPYAVPPEKHHLRAALEGITVVGVGLVDYLLNTNARGGHLAPGDQRWDLRYDWPIFRQKLTGDYYRLDTNRLNTNYISHPFAGAMYYTAARANHLSVFESFGYATVGSFMWEYFGEFREEVSINDVIATPVGGAAIGETLMQLGGFFKRGRKSFVTDALSVLLAPARAINDWADGEAPLRSGDVDDLGLAREPWHRFDLFAGASATWQPTDAPDRAHTAYGDARLGLDTRVVALPGYAGAAQRSAIFDDGNASHFRFDMAMSEGKLHDALFLAEVMPAGYYWRHASLDDRGRLRGDGALVGLRASFEYAAHTYDRGRGRPMDVVVTVSPIGIGAEYTHDAGPFRLRSRVDVAGGLVGVVSDALVDYRRRHAGDDTDLQTVLREQGYYHALGVTLMPSVSLTYGAFELGGRARLDSFAGIRGFDEQQDRIAHEHVLADRRVELAASVTYRLPGTHFIASLEGRRLGRMGDVGEVHTSRSELSLGGTLGLRF